MPISMSPRWCRGSLARGPEWRGNLRASPDARRAWQRHQPRRRMVPRGDAPGRSLTDDVEQNSDHCRDQPGVATGSRLAPEFLLDNPCDVTKVGVELRPSGTLIGEPHRMDHQLNVKEEFVRIG